MPPAKSKNSLQFSMRTLMAMITVVCVVLALPAGYVLLAVVTVWMLIGAAMIWVLMVFRAPISHFLSGVKVNQKDK